MFLGRQYPYFEDDHTTKCNLQIQCDRYQITRGIFYRTSTKSFTIRMETQKTRTARAVLRRKIGTGVINLPNSRLYYKATVIKTVWHWHKKETYGLMKQDRGTRNKPMHLWVPYF